MKINFFKNHQSSNWIKIYSAHKITFLSQFFIQNRNPISSSYKKVEQITHSIKNFTDSSNLSNLFAWSQEHSLFKRISLNVYSQLDNSKEQVCESKGYLTKFISQLNSRVSLTAIKTLV